MGRILRPKRGTYNSISSEILSSGEIFLEVPDTDYLNGAQESGDDNWLKIKVGDGSHTYAKLPYAIDPSSLSGGSSSGDSDEGTSYVSYGGTQVGTGTKPIYVTAGGVATASSASVGSTTKPIYMSGGTLTASNSTIGGTARPMYLKSGEMTAISDTVGSGIKPVYMSSGTITASSSTVGSASTPVYLNAGTITKCTSITADSASTLGSSTVGSGVIPIYLKTGSPMASSSNVGSSTQPIYLNSGVITAGTTTVGSSYSPIYLKDGILTEATSIVQTTAKTTSGTTIGQMQQITIGTVTLVIVQGIWTFISLHSNLPVPLYPVAFTAKAIYGDNSSYEELYNYIGSIDTSGNLTMTRITLGSSTTTSITATNYSTYFPNTGSQTGNMLRVDFTYLTQ